MKQCIGDTRCCWVGQCCLPRVKQHDSLTLLPVILQEPHCPMCRSARRLSLINGRSSSGHSKARSWPACESGCRTRCREPLRVPPVLYICIYSIRSLSNEDACLGLPVPGCIQLATDRFYVRQGASTVIANEIDMDESFRKLKGVTQKDVSPNQLVGDSVIVRSLHIVEGSSQVGAKEISYDFDC